MGITIGMALVDFIPVVLFFISAVILQRELYPYLVTGAYSLLAAGSIMVFVGGFFKALWKLLYGLNLCDYVLLNHSFFPMQGPGFVLFFMGLAGIWYKGKKKDVVSFSAVPVVFVSSLPFIIMQVIGLGGSQIVLAIVGLKKGNKKAALLFVLAFICMLGMGYLGAKFDDSSSMNWLAQVVNIFSMGFFLLGTLSVKKSGFDIHK